MPRVGRAAEAVQFENGLSCMGCLAFTRPRGEGRWIAWIRAPHGLRSAPGILVQARPRAEACRAASGAEQSRCRDLIFVIVLGVLLRSRA